MEVERPFLYVLAVAAAAAAAAAALLVAGGGTPPSATDASILTVAGPTEALAGERYALYGGAVAGEGDARLHARVCERGRPCRLLRSTDVTGTGESWHWLGVFVPERAGELVADVLLLRAGPGGYRTLDRVSWNIAVYGDAASSAAGPGPATVRLAAPAPTSPTACSGTGEALDPGPVHLTDNYAYRFQACRAGTFNATLTPHGVEPGAEPRVAVWFAGAPLADLVVTSATSLEVSVPSSGWLALAYVNDPVDDVSGLAGMGVTLSDLAYAATP